MPSISARWAASLSRGLHKTMPLSSRACRSRLGLVSLDIGRTPKGCLKPRRAFAGRFRHPGLAYRGPEYRTRDRARSQGEGLPPAEHPRRPGRRLGLLERRSAAADPQAEGRQRQERDQAGVSDAAGDSAARGAQPEMMALPITLKRRRRGRQRRRTSAGWWLWSRHRDYGAYRFGHGLDGETTATSPDNPVRPPA